eukprot:631194-Amphidinium_carterae.1
MDQGNRGQLIKRLKDCLYDGHSCIDLLLRCVLRLCALAGAPMRQMFDHFGDLKGFRNSTFSGSFVCIVTVVNVEAEP